MPATGVFQVLEFLEYVLNILFHRNLWVAIKDFSIEGVFFSGLLLWFKSNRKSPEKKTLYWKVFSGGPINCFLPNLLFQLLSKFLPFTQIIYFASFSFPVSIFYLIFVCHLARTSKDLFKIDKNWYHCLADKSRLVCIIISNRVFATSVSILIPTAFPASTHWRVTTPLADSGWLQGRPVQASAV